MIVKNSYLNGCYIESREKDRPLIELNEDGSVTVRLDHYAVIPMEKYKELVSNGS